MKFQCVTCGNDYDWEPHPDHRRSNTCSQECRRIRKNVKNEEARQRAVVRGCPADKHGTATGYTHFKCGCPLCKQWAREYKRARRALEP